LGHDKVAATVTATSHSAVESIVGALADLEGEIDSMGTRVDEMKKRLLAHSNEEVDKLKQQIISMANEEAKSIVEAARAEAESESEQIMRDAEKNLAAIKKNIDASFDKAVESIVKTVLGQETTEKPEKQSPKIKKYSSEGKPVN
jgi:vacuolar-type H+-ATPase subunit H